MMNKLVSVIMSVYNEESEWLRQSIESILNQTYSNLEFIIVVDNPECQRINELLFEYKNKDNRIVVLKNEKNIGLVESLNKALRNCNGEYIARMDADDISLKCRLEKQVDYLEKNNLDFVMSNIDKIDEYGKIINKENDTSNISVSKFKNMIRYCNIATHPTWLMKKKIYIQLQGYRNINKCEDYDFVLRALQDGFKISKMKESLLLYRIRSNSITQSSVLEQYCNSQYLRKKYCQNYKISKISKLDIEHKYLSLDKNKCEKFDRSYYYFKKNNILRTAISLIKDNIFREYIIYNLKLVIVMMRFRRT